MAKKITDTEIISKIKDESQIDYCAICGKCLSVCPTYRESRLETDSPRGRLNLITSALKKDFIPGQKFAESITGCLLCGACSSTCPREISPSEAIQFIRSHKIFKPFKSRLESLILNKIVSSQKKIKYLTLPLKLYQKSGLQKTIRKNLSKVLPEKIKMLEAMMPLIPEKKFTDMVKEIEIPENPNNKTVLYFPGCTMNYMLPEASFSTVRLLLNIGTKVIIPKDFFCCGAPHIHEGEFQAARELAEKNIELLNKYKVDNIITDCAACGASLKKYAFWFNDDKTMKEKCLNISEKIMDISEYLIKSDFDWSKVKIPPEMHNFSVTFDNPCELRHAQKIKNYPEQILKKIKGINFIKMKESDWCCGSAGAFVIKNPIESERIFKRKAEILKAIKADILLILNPGCYFQYKSGVERCKIKTRILYYTEFLSSLIF